MTKNKTIAAISTAQGAGGIGVIRISGENAKEIADKIFTSFSGKKLIDSPGYTAHYGKVIDKTEYVDEAIALVFNKPKSYTGEDVVEISCHGGIYITKKILRLIIEAGASPAEAGEFTKRAFLNGKMSLTQAESVMYLISAKGRQAARAALFAREGALFKRIQGVKKELLNITAHLAAWADYPDEDIEVIEKDNLLDSLNRAKEDMGKHISNYDTAFMIREGIETVIVGRPNVGKSTLMNLLSGCERSIVTDIPGTTRDIVEETVSLGDVILRLADTAGIRNTEDPIEKIGVFKAKNRIKTSGLVLAVFDASRELGDEDKELLEEIKDMPAIAIINKSDLENKIDIEYIKSKIEQVVFISALSGEGLQKLSDAVLEVTNTKDFDPSAGVLANERQRNAAIGAKACIEEALAAIDMGFTLDAITVSLEGAIGELLSLTGERTSEAVVDEVFSRFCVGK